jgi:hypothetical protein
MTFTRQKVDTVVEEQIVTAAIISEPFISKINQIVDLEYFVNPYARTIYSWCRRYYEEYGLPPAKTIEDIYKIESSGLDPSQAEIISKFLTTLSKRYVDNQGINDEYIMDNALKYFKRRELETKAEIIKRLTDVGRIEDAEKEMMNYRKVAYQLSGFFDPFDLSEVISTYADEGEGDLELFGAMGKMIGPIERGWLIGMLGPFKRGKTFWLQEVAISGILRGLRVVWFSFEMTKKNLKARVYKRITGSGAQETYEFPLFDCKLNQDNSCDASQRTCSVAMTEQGYEPCDYCRKRSPRDYQFISYMVTKPMSPFSVRNTVKEIEAFSKMYHRNLRINCYPRFSASIADMERDLQLLEMNEQFIPDVIVVDYADIIKPPGKLEGRQALDEIWKQLSALAGARHAIVVTGSQGTRGSLTKKNMSQDDLAEWIGKLAHVDVFLCLNQTKEEKQKKIMRVGTLVHRHKDFNENMQATLLQQLDTGQFCIDSDMLYTENE